MAGQCHCWAGLNLPLEAYANGPAQIRNRNYSKRQRSQSSHDRKADQKDNPNAVVAYYVIQEKEDNEEKRHNQIMLLKEEDDSF
jgi:hypothetical protein